jgi:hypothetical protein
MCYYEMWRERDTDKGIRCRTKKDRPSDIQLLGFLRAKAQSSQVSFQTEAGSVKLISCNFMFLLSAGDAPVAHSHTDDWDLGFT